MITEKKLLKTQHDQSQKLILNLSLEIISFNLSGGNLSYFCPKYQVSKQAFIKYFLIAIKLIMYVAIQHKTTNISAMIYPVIIIQPIKIY